jgi:TPP-dependent pyruvate/acetoin dehydrogenase alpha subunit
MVLRSGARDTGLPALAPIYEEIPRRSRDPQTVQFVLWRRMLLIRKFEELVDDLYANGRIRGSAHPYIGMEAGAVGVISALTRDDAVVGYYRAHGHALALGLSPQVVAAEILGRKGGCCGGRGGTKHLMAIDRGYYGAYAIVGQQLPIAVGIAWSIKRRPKKVDASGVVVCFFGEGAVNQGVSLEAWNLAQVIEVPCLFVCENNQYSVSTRSSAVTAGSSVVERARGFGIDGEQVDGMDVMAVRAAALAARKTVVATGRPFLLELVTYRFRGHSIVRRRDDYRTAEELESWRSRDPLARIATVLDSTEAMRDLMAKTEDEMSLAISEAGTRAVNDDLADAADESAVFASLHPARIGRSRGR